jgi:hypothetical protein
VFFIFLSLASIYNTTCPIRNRYGHLPSLESISQKEWKTLETFYSPFIGVAVSCVWLADNIVCFTAVWIATSILEIDRHQRVTHFWSSLSPSRVDSSHAGLSEYLWKRCFIGLSLDNFRVCGYPNNLITDKSGHPGT